MDSIVFERTWKKGDTFKFGLISDPHIEPGGENLELKKALDKCREEKATVLFNGDLADFITVKDPRYNKATDRAEMAAIINEQIESVVDFLSPYADIIELMGIGNHEDVLIKHYGIDPLRFILRDLNRMRKDKGLPPIHYGAYRGFIMYRFKYGSGNRSKSLRIFRHHGAGGSAPVTGGAIDLNRIMSGFDADVYWCGHKHQQTMRGVRYVSVNSAGAIVSSIKNAIMTPGFQAPYHEDDFNKTGGNSSFEDRFYNTNPTGWGWLVVKPYNLSSGNDMDLDIELMVRN